MKDYHEGKAKTISGIQAKDDKTVVIKYSKLSPSMLWGDGFIYAFSNAKQIAKVTDFARFGEAELTKTTIIIWSLCNNKRSTRRECYS